MTCRECDRPMRPWGTTRADHPGTVITNGRGLCTRCHNHARNNGTLIDYPRATEPFTGRPSTGDYDLYAPLHPIGHDDPDPRVRDCARELTTWLYDRRERGIPTKGLGT